MMRDYIFEGKGIVFRRDLPGDKMGGVVSLPDGVLIHRVHHFQIMAFKDPKDGETIVVVYYLRPLEDLEHEEVERADED
jgi:hypothetical protein